MTVRKRLKAEYGAEDQERCREASDRIKVLMLEIALEEGMSLTKSVSACAAAMVELGMLSAPKDMPLAVVAERITGMVSIYCCQNADLEAEKIGEFVDGSVPEGKSN